MQIYLKSGFLPKTNNIFRFLAKIRSLIHKESEYYRDIPVIINNFNRLDYLKLQVGWLEKAGMKNIYIIDNKSTYPPLLEYYKKLKHIIFRLDQNVGHTAIWDTHIYLWFSNGAYVYTDPDVLPVENCPLNAVEYFHKLLMKYSEIGKVGFGLKIDDIPAFYPLHDKVLSWEKQFWQKEVEPGVFDAMIDTTFALYRKGSKGDAGMMKALRTSGEYLARHLSWYLDPSDLSDDEKYYQSHATKVGSWNESLKGNETPY